MTIHKRSKCARRARIYLRCRPITAFLGFRVLMGPWRHGYANICARGRRECPYMCCLHCGVGCEYSCCRKHTSHMSSVWLTKTWRLSFLRATKRHYWTSVMLCHCTKSLGRLISSLKEKYINKHDGVKPEVCLNHFFFLVPSLSCLTLYSSSPKMPLMLQSKYVPRPQLHALSGVVSHVL